MNAFIALMIRTGHLDQPENEQSMTSQPKEDEAILRDYVRRHFGDESPAADNGEVR